MKQSHDGCVHMATSKRTDKYLDTDTIFGIPALNNTTKDVT